MDHTRELKRQDLENTRKHIKDTLAQLSRMCPENPLGGLRVLGAARPHLHHGAQRSDKWTKKAFPESSWGVDVSAALFYCLIDNYSAATSILNEFRDHVNLIVSRILSFLYSHARQLYSPSL